MSADRALRVGLLHFTAPPIVGGVEAIIGHQAAGLLARGHQVTVLAGRGRAFRRGLDFRLVPALDSKYPALLRINAELKRGCLSPAFSQMTELLENELEALLAQLDVCIVHNAMTLHFNLPLTAALHQLTRARRACPLVAWCHDLSWANPLYLPLLREELPWTLLKTAAPRTSYVVVSEDRRQDLARLAGLDPERLAVIPAGVNLSRKLGLGRSTRQLLAEYRLSEADPFILLPARITRRKNIEFAILVVAELRRLGWSPKLLVTGPRGPHDDPGSIRYVRELQALCEKVDVTTDVILLQTKPGLGGRTWKPTDAMMDELYRAADLMLFPSAQEGFGIPLLEAGAVNLPLFCADIPPFREIAGTQAEFFALDALPAAVAARIGRFMEQDARYGLRRRVRRAFDWDAIFDQQLVPLLQAATESDDPPATLQPSDSRVGVR